MVEHTHADEPDESLMTRRRAAAGLAGVAVGGVGLISASINSASAQVSMGEFDAEGTSQTLSQAPDAVRLSASGEWRVETAGAIEQVMITLQAEVNGEMADLDTQRAFDVTEGSYSLSADVIEQHPDVDATDFMPDETGTEKATHIDVRVVVGAVRNGEVAAEASVRDTATVTVTAEGVEVSVGGSAEVEIEPAD